MPGLIRTEVLDIRDGLAYLTGSQFTVDGGALPTL